MPKNWDAGKLSKQKSKDVRFSEGKIFISLQANQIITLEQ